LFALVAQIVLSFGHVHVPGKPSALSAFLSQAAQSQSTGVDRLDRPAKPPKYIAHDQCAICTSIELAGHLMAAAAPTLLSLADLSRNPPAIRADVALAATPHLSFQARAPPQA
jgi:hypothetical protein